MGECSFLICESIVVFGRGETAEEGGKEGEGDIEVSACDRFEPREERGEEVGGEGWGCCS